GLERAAGSAPPARPLRTRRSWRVRRLGHPGSPLDLEASNVLARRRAEAGAEGANEVDGMNAGLGREGVEARGLAKGRAQPFLGTAQPRHAVAAGAPMLAKADGEQLEGEAFEGQGPDIVVVAELRLDRVAEASEPRVGAPPRLVGQPRQGPRGGEARGVELDLQVVAPGPADRVGMERSRGPKDQRARRAR